MKVSSISFTVFCYETEDKNKIVTSIISFLKDFREYVDIKELKLQGHYGDTIISIKYEIKGKMATSAAEALLSRLDTSDIIFLIGTLGERVDRSKLHLRLDKQKLVGEGKLTVKDGNDVIKVIISSNGGIDKIKEELKQIANRAMS
ncbi:hypothetical protein CM19_09180 [Candidatus Acidianus copahuensis]|uniref:Exosome protein n=1 Tax=Candidatus Acidianus copahuensis TaxID=1160895 RepID=A0A031LMH7_9CREN|nr:RNA-binding domain-containing protein [Candidatus Acidianus copahuensis]EZQ03881.1 hypothetical protein CM19_09180 [Candidatus Acidianus copahuensis]